MAAHMRHPHDMTPSSKTTGPRRWHLRQALLLATVFSLQAGAAPVANRLQCGSVTGFKTEAEMRAVPDLGVNAVDLTFIGAKPANKAIDKSLRECAAVAAKRDPSRDILVSAWSRKRTAKDSRNDKLLHPHGPTKYLSYEASSKTIAVRKLKLQKK
jgi:hypothetical protein